MEKKKYKKEVVIEENFSGRIEHSNMGMRSADELETFYLEKGDWVVIYRLRTKERVKYEIKSVKQSLVIFKKMMGEDKNDKSSRYEFRKLENKFRKLEKELETL